MDHSVWKWFSIVSFVSWIYIFFSHGLYVSTLEWRLPLQTGYLPLLSLKSFWKTLSLPVPVELPSSQGILFTIQVLWEVCIIWLVLQHVRCTYHPQSSGLVKCTNAITKIPLAKFIESPMPTDTSTESIAVGLSKSQNHLFWNLSTLTLWDSHRHLRQFGSASLDTQLT